MLPKIENQDVLETVSKTNELGLEDEIFMAVEKLQALSEIQTKLNTTDGDVSLMTLSHYAQVLHEEVRRLRELLHQHFD